MYAVHNERELPAARRSSLVDCKQQLLRGLGTGVTAALGGGAEIPAAKNSYPGEPQVRGAVTSRFGC